MRFSKAWLPAGGYWSSPFCKWQGKFADLHTLRLAATVTTQALAERQISASELDALVLGWTIPSQQIFYGAPWLAGMIGAPDISGPMISQACATSAAALAHAAATVDAGASRATLVVLADRTSNGPHLYYPSSKAPGGRGKAEDWVWDNFGADPWAGEAMVQTAEYVAGEAGITRQEQDALAVHRYQQYAKALQEGFHGRFMVSPVEVNPSGRRIVATVEGDEGIFPTTAEGLAKLRPVMRDGSITFGTQTFPADGNAGLVVCDRDQAVAWSAGGEPVQVLSFALARVEKARMAKAVVPAARQALQEAGLSVGDVRVIKTHNPFVVNDIYFGREMGIEAESFNNYGSSLIYGHPQAPTGARLIAEGIEEARLLGGGPVLFVGCAAGDTAAAVVVRVA